MDNSVMNDISYGLYIIGTAADNALAGCVVNSVFQISANPVKVAVSLNHDNYTTACIQNTREFSVSVLTESAPMDLIAKFGFATSRENSKFGGLDFDLLLGNIPVLKEHTSAWLHCRVENMVDTGTHMLFVAEVVDSERISDEAPMTYAYYHKNVKGKTPPKAPNYQPDEADGGEYVCDVCGYVYKGDFDALDDDWKCPICGVGKDRFTKR